MSVGCMGPGTSKILFGTIFMLILSYPQIQHDELG